MIDRVGLREVSNPVSRMRKPETSSMLDGKSGGSFNPEKAKNLAAEIRQSTKPRETLEYIAHPHELGNGQNYSKLAQLTKEASIKRWGVCHSEAEFNKNMKVWEGQMEKWYQNLNPNMQLRLREIMKNLDIQAEKNIYDWSKLHSALFSNGKVDFAKFIEAVKNVPDFKATLPVAKDLAGIFGSEVRSALFEKKSVRKLEHEKIIRKAQAEGKIDREKMYDSSKERWINHTEQRKKTVEDVYKAGKIDATRRDKYIRYLEKEQGNNERVLNFNGVTFEGFSQQEQDYVKSAMKMLPQELIYHINKVKIVDRSEMKGGKGVMCYSSWGEYQKGVVGIAPETFGYDKATFTRKILHEIGGHGLRDMVQALNPNLHKKMMELWSQTTAQHRGLLGKDDYSRRIIDGTIFKDHLRYGNSVYASVDEFWSDRMAEYFYAKAMRSQGLDERVYSNRDTSHPFSQAEEEAVQRVCEETFQIWRQAIEQTNLTVKPNVPKKEESIFQNRQNELKEIQEQFNNNGYYEGNIPDGVVPRSEGTGAFKVPILIDRNNDSVLREMIGRAKRLNQEIQGYPQEERYMRLLQLVDEYTSGSGEQDSENPQTWERARDFVSQYLRLAGNKIDNFPVQIGQFTVKGQAGGGTCVPRALLVRILGSEMGLKPRLHRGTLVKRHHVEGAGKGGSHMWNMIPENNLVLESFRAKKYRSNFAEYQVRHQARQPDDSNVRMWYYDSRGQLVVAV